MQNTYGSLQAMAAELDRQETVKQDYVVPATEISIAKTPYEDEPYHVLFGDDEFAPTKRFHAQVADKLKIPKNYYDRMKEESPYLLAENVNHWFGESEKKHMVRTLDSKARALVSDRFFPMDNMFVMNAILPSLSADMGIEFKTNTLTDDRMYMQLIFRNMQKDIVVGDAVQWGLSFTNSETGLGAFDIKTYVWRLKCSNGLIGQSLIRKFHVGRQLKTEDEGYELFKSDTVMADVKALELKTRDIVSNMINGPMFDEYVLTMQGAREDEIRKPEKVIENVTRRMNISEKHREDMLESMVIDKEFNRYGLANSITALAHKLEDPDEQYEVEKLGHKIITLQPSEWKVLSEVA